MLGPAAIRRLSMRGVAVRTRPVQPFTCPASLRRSSSAGPHSPPTPVLARISNAVREWPLTVAMASMAAKAAVVDVAVQCFVERREVVDRRRTATFAIFGCLWMGGAQYFIYSRWMEAIVIPSSAAATAAAKVCFDQLVYVPALFLPVFFVVNQTMRGDPHPLQAARAQYERELWLTLKTTWPPSFAMQYVGFRFVPPHLRIPYVAACSLVSTTLLSVLRGYFSRGPREPEPEPEEPNPKAASTRLASRTTRTLGEWLDEKQGGSGK